MLGSTFRWMLVCLIVCAFFGSAVSFPTAKLQKEPPCEKQTTDRVKHTLLDDGSHQVEVSFPNNADPVRTSWKIKFRVSKVGASGENLEILSAYFRPHVNGPEYQILNRSGLSETVVAYNDGTTLYFDVTRHNNGLMKLLPTDLKQDNLCPCSVMVPNSKDKIAMELRDRGLLWKTTRAGGKSRRGQEFIIWSVMDNVNYLNATQFGFRDDGTITFRLGSTGHNLIGGMGNNTCHLHLGIWRVDVDLGGTKNTPYLVNHHAPRWKRGEAEKITELFNNGREGFADWEDKLFTSLLIKNLNVNNKNGNPISYQVVPQRSGSSRLHHPGPGEGDVKFTLHDFWVHRYDNGGDDCRQLPAYVSKAQSIQNQDIVFWYISAARHNPRDEDFVNGVATATVLMWSGFDFRPRGVFNGTPLYP